MICLNKMELTDFTNVEVTELQKYIETNVNYTILQKLFVLTENPLDKAKVFTIVYRILESCRNYTSNDKTKKKLKSLLDDAKEIYNEIYTNLIKYTGIDINFGKNKILERIVSCFLDIENNKKINKIIDLFLVLGEKIELGDMDNFVGLDLETDQGKKVYKDIAKVLK